MNIIKKARVFLVNRKLKKINKDLLGVQDIKNFLVLENKRLDLLDKIYKIKGKKK